MTIDQYKKQYKSDDAVGWLCMDEQIEKLYPLQQPRHYAPVLHYMLGGKDPLDGMSIYDSSKQYPHYHFITYGMNWVLFKLRTEN